MSRGSRKGFDYRTGKPAQWSKEEVAILKAEHQQRRVGGDTLIFDEINGERRLIAEIYE